MTVNSKIRFKEGQREGMEYLVSRNTALLADDIGFGKTVEVIAALNYLKARKVLIISPATMKDHWAEKTVEFGDYPYKIQILQGTKMKLDTSADMWILNYDLLITYYQKIKKQLRYGVIVCDESHRVKSPTAKRTRRVLHPDYGLAIVTKHRWFISGTPIQNRPLDVYPILRAFFAKELGHAVNYRTYQYKFCGAYDDEHGRLVLGFPNKKAREDLSKILSRFMLRRMRPKSHGLVWQEILFDKTPEYLALENQQKQEINYDGYTAANLMDIVPILNHQQLWHEASKLMAYQAIDHIEDLLLSVDKLLVFAYHRESIGVLSEGLKKYNPVIIHGGVATTKRTAIKKKFIDEPECRVFIGQIDSMGEGMDGLQHVCNTMVFVETNYNPEIIKQCVGRLDREGQTRSVLAHLLLVRGGISQDIYRLAMKKGEVIKDIIKATEMRR